MNQKYKGLILGCALTGTMLLSGCSFGKFLDSAVGTADADNSVNVTASSSTASVDILMGEKVDEAVNAPTFSKNLSGSIAAVQGSALKLEATAEVGDGGTVTYQWYTNNVNANGGGTPIEGATANVLTVDTSETKTTYYYVVATNTKGDAINMSVSDTKGVAVWAQGEWKKDDKGLKYVVSDDSFPVDTQFIEGGKLYTVNAEGYSMDGGQVVPETIS